MTQTRTHTHRTLENMWIFKRQLKGAYQEEEEYCSDQNFGFASPLYMQRYGCARARVANGLYFTIWKKLGFFFQRLASNQILGFWRMGGGGVCGVAAMEQRTAGVRSSNLERERERERRGFSRSMCESDEKGKRIERVVEEKR